MTVLKGKHIGRSFFGDQCRRRSSPSVLQAREERVTVCREGREALHGARGPPWGAITPLKKTTGKSRFSTTDSIESFCKVCSQSISIQLNEVEVLQSESSSDWKQIIIADWKTWHRDAEMIFTPEGIAG
ncbi:hypothetical protein P4C99_08955 [Pontiellaceae bacterium B1224]|nr:hypothetical protein [Pontiellaceae bacterium B1224]